MKKPHAFRPSLSDVLEDRLVLSTAHAAAVHHATIQPFQGNNLGAIQDQVNAAFNSFAQDYAQAQSAYLSSASTNPQAITGLNTFVANRVGGLVGQLGGIVGTMRGASVSTASMLTGALSGTNLGTLQQRLQSITPVGTNGQTAASFAKQANDTINFANNVVGQSFQTFGNIENINAYAQYQSQFASNRHVPLTRAQQRQVASLKAAGSQVSQAFSSFFNGFQNARNNVLFGTGTGTGGTVDMAANQAQFNSQLSSGLVGFATNLSAALGRVRGASTTLQPSIVASLFGVGNGNGGTARQIGVTTNGLSPSASTANGFGTVGTSAIRPVGTDTPAPTNNPLQYVVGTQGTGTSTGAISPPGSINPVSNPSTNPFQYLVGTQGQAQGGTTGAANAAGNDLFSTIAGLAAPTDMTGLSAQQFNTSAFNALNTAYSNIQGRLNVFSQNPNFNFSPFNSISTGSSPFFNSSGLFTPPTTGSSSSAPIFNGGFFDNTFSPRSFSTGVSSATGFGTTGFSSFLGATTPTGTTGTGGSFTTFNPTILPDGNFFSSNGPTGLGSSNGTRTTNAFGGAFSPGVTNPNNGFFGSSFGSF